MPVINIPKRLGNFSFWQIYPNDIPTIRINEILNNIISLSKKIKSWFFLRLKICRSHQLYKRFKQMLRENLIPLFNIIQWYVRFLLLFSYHTLFLLIRWHHQFLYRYHQSIFLPYSLKVDSLCVAWFSCCGRHHYSRYR